MNKILFFFVLLFAFFSLSSKTYAYVASQTDQQMPALPNTSSLGQFDWSAITHYLSAPLASISSGLPSSLSSFSLPQDINGWTQNAFAGFDAWLYGVLGFHITNLFVLFLNLLAWILALAKQIVDWLLSIFH